MELHERIKAAQSAEADHSERQVDPFAELKTRLHLAIIGELGPQLYNSGGDAKVLARPGVTSIERAPGRGGRPVSRRPRRVSTTRSTRHSRLRADRALARRRHRQRDHDQRALRRLARARRPAHQDASRFNDESHLRRIINKMVGQIGRRIDESSPMVDARLPDGSRVNAIIPPLSLTGPLVTIRKFRRKRSTSTTSSRLGSLSSRRPSSSSSASAPS